MTFLRLFLSLVWILFLGTPLVAQNVAVRIESDSTGCRIGEPIPVNLSVSAPTTWKLLPPDLRQGIEGAEYVEEGEAEEESRDGQRVLHIPYVVTVFDSGATTVRFQVRYRIPGDTTVHRTSSNALVFHIRGVEVDTAKGHRDIMNVLPVGYQWWEYLLYGIAFLGGIGLLVFALMLFRNLRALPKLAAVPPPTPEVHLPAHIIALEKLHHLETMHLWEQGEDKAFQSILSGILREYLELRYGLPALEQPTAETVSSLSVHIGATGTLQMATRLLSLADMTKFAKFHPTHEQHAECMRLAIRFVETTKEDDGWENPLETKPLPLPENPGATP